MAPISAQAGSAAWPTRAGPNPTNMLWFDRLPIFFLERINTVAHDVGTIQRASICSHKLCPPLPIAIPVNSLWYRLEVSGLLHWGFLLSFYKPIYLIRRFDHLWMSEPGPMFIKLCHRETAAIKLSSGASPSNPPALAKNRQRRIHWLLWERWKKTH